MIKNNSGKEEVLANFLSHHNPLPGDSPEMDGEVHSTTALFSEQKIVQLKQETTCDSERNFL